MECIKQDNVIRREQMPILVAPFICRRSPERRHSTGSSHVLSVQYIVCDREAATQRPRGLAPRHGSRPDLNKSANIQIVNRNVVVDRVIFCYMDVVLTRQCKRSTAPQVLTNIYTGTIVQLDNRCDSSFILVTFILITYFYVPI